MTNKSFILNLKDKKYIIRTPGVGTNNLINRYEEFDTYNAIKDKNISDEIIYINPKDGCKISKYFENSRNCNPNDEKDLKICMTKLKELHNLNLKVKHEFNILEKILFYETLMNKKSKYMDYEQTKENVKELLSFIDSLKKEKCLCHIDAVCDNFIFTKDENVKLIDFEYAAMQDPHLDIAMFSLYSLYNKEKVDKLINIYFENNCSNENRIKIYAYISVCGLLWSNWCEYKHNLGINFGEYASMQYSLSKEFYILAKKMMKNNNI